MTAIREVECGFVREALLARREIALLDVREEAEFATGHPLFAASLPLSTLEVEVFDRIPRRSVPIVCYDNEEGLADRAAVRLLALGYSEVGVLRGGLAAWKAAGLEVFSDVNAPSKAFGELVDAILHPPSIEPGELLARIDSRENLVVFDARRFDEYETMSVPSARSVPGGELVRRFAELVEDPDTLVVVNCAGRTRSIIGTQSLVNAGVANKVVALRNGTIGWTLAGLELDRGASKRHPTANTAARQASDAARRLANDAGVIHIDAAELQVLRAQHDSTTYYFDVRDPEEYAVGHRVGFRSAPGGQLVQETDYFAPVRGATIVVNDDDGVRADMAASWLAQMGWSTRVLVGLAPAPELERGRFKPSLPSLPDVGKIEIGELTRQLSDGNVVVFDLARSRTYRAGHIPGSSFVLRSELSAHVDSLSASTRVVLTSPDGIIAMFGANDLKTKSNREVLALDGGTASWQANELPIETATHQWLSLPLDTYRRPYEGTGVDPDAMQAYLEWEYGLVAQLERDGTHGFFVLGAPA
jgi:rhodanese-related sulfurtransferase